MPMTAVEYLREFKRMCDNYSDCEDCPLEKITEKRDCDCWARENPEKTVEIVEKWSKEHPKKTYLDDFKEKFPKHIILDEEIYKLKRCDFYGLARNEKCEDFSTCKDCWNAEYVEGLND